MQPPLIPRGWPALLSAVVAAVLGWGAMVLPWRQWTTFAVITTVVAVVHAGHAGLALSGHHSRALAWRVQALAALSYFAYLGWNLVRASVYIASLYGGLGKGVAVGLMAVLAVVALLVVPLSVWGLVATGGVKWTRLGRGAAAVAVVLISAGLWRVGGLAEAEAAFEPELVSHGVSDPALGERIKAAIPPNAARAAGVPNAPSLMVRQSVECATLPGPGRPTVVATSIEQVSEARVEARARCFQGSTLDETIELMAQSLRTSARRGPIKIDLITGTQVLQPLVPVVDALLLRPGLDGVCEQTRCLMPWQLLALDQFNTYTPIPVIPDLRFGFDAAILRKAIVWPDRPTRYDPSLSGLVRLEVASFLYDDEEQWHRLRRMRAPRRPVDKNRLQAAVDAAERYLLSAQGADGRFEYTVDPFTGRVSYRGFALARQAGTTLVLCELARDHDRAREVVRKALAVLVGQMHSYHDLGMVIPAGPRPPPQVGLGSTALTAIALLSCRARVGDQFDDAIERMTRFLLRMRRDNGSFYPAFDLLRGEPVPGPDPLYAVGQAVFALTLLERLLMEESLPAMPSVVETRQTVEAAMTYTATDYWDNFATDFFWMEENWHCLAARASLGHHRHEAYERFCIDYTQYKTRLILSQDDRVADDFVGGYGFGNVLFPHNTGSAGFGEAMAAALALKRARGEPTGADEVVLRRALEFLVYHQWDRVGCFACATTPHSMVGAVSEHMGSPQIRIDFVQHAMAGMGHGGRMLQWGRGGPLE